MSGFGTNVVRTMFEHGGVTQTAHITMQGDSPDTKEKLRQVHSYLDKEYPGATLLVVDLPQI